MRNRALYFVLFIAATTPSFAQQRTADSQSDRVSDVHAKVEQLANPTKHFYKLSYVLRETDEGKVLNQRNFVVTINQEATDAHGEVTGDPRWWSVRAGTRVPMLTSSGEGEKFTYADVGVNLDSRGYEVGDAFQLEISTEISSLGADNAGKPTLPLIRQVKVRSAVVAPFGKQTTVFTADDPASKNRFELEVTPTRER